MDRYEIFVVGAGAAGMSAALSAWQAGCRSILLADRADTLGGILPQCIHHGFGGELTGGEYARNIEDELKKTGVKIALSTSVVSVSGDKTALLSSRDGLRPIAFEKMILSTGCREIPFGALGVVGTRPAGIFTAGQAQELINLRHQKIGREAVVMGSGDLGMIIARRFTVEGGHVAAVVEKESHYGGMARNFRRCIEAYSIPLVCSAKVVRTHGEGRLQGVTVMHTDALTQEYIPCDTLITAVGMVQDQTLIKGLGSPSWLTLCGNCSKIHDIVDSAVDEAKKAGAQAAGK